MTPLEIIQHIAESTNTQVADWRALPSKMTQLCVERHFSHPAGHAAIVLDNRGALTFSIEQM